MATPESENGRQRARRKDVTVLIVDDEAAFHETISRYLGAYRCFSAYNARQALTRLARHHVDVILLDLNLPGMSGLELLSRLRNTATDVEVIVITSHAEIERAVEAVKLGAFDFLAKSYENYQQIAAHIRRALAHRRRRRAVMAQANDDAWDSALALVEGSTSHTMREVASILRQVAATPLTVLIEGESGVGKEMLARYVHMNSDRASGPLIAVNMAATPASLIEASLFGHEKGAFTGADRQRLGKFELADGGTLFLDEIGELEPPVQAKLLRVIQEREVERLGAAEPAPVDVRLIAASNRNLEQEVLAGRFREDLWFRLNVVRVQVPPLRARAGDVPALAELLSERAAITLKREPLSFSGKALEVLKAYSWPGNVRELENLIMRLVALHGGTVVRASDIPIEFSMEHLSALATKIARRYAQAGGNLYKLAVRQFERYLVAHMVQRCHGNMAEAARKLGVSYATVKNKMGKADDTGE